MGNETELLASFQDVISKRHQYATEWKARTGGKVVGWLCTYSPVELVYAAGLLPVRILGSHDGDRIADRYIYGNFCPFCHDCLAQRLRGRYDYMDGIVHARTCEHITNVYYNWAKETPSEFSYFIYMPGNLEGPRGARLVYKEYIDFKAALEKWTGKTISQKDLDNAIQLYNRNRTLLKQVYEYRKGQPPTLTGAEALEVVVAGQLMDIAEHNKLLEKLLEGLPKRKVQRDTGVRLMLVGSEYDDIAFIKKVEELGATCVIEVNCSGTRYFWDEIVPEEDRLMAIASRYYTRYPCPAADWRRARTPSVIMGLVKDFKVEAALIYYQKFCSPHQYEAPFVKKLLDANNIPNFKLEFDSTVPFGQFKTRIEAFLETLVPIF